jgi:hypothetical protein
MKHYYNILRTSVLLALILLMGVCAQAQSGADMPVRFNKTSHNFGKFSINAGKQHCSFEFTNQGNAPVVIFNVISSCGCTEPVWPKEPIMPGKGGKIEVTFLNDQGPYPFEKTLTVYTSASKKPILLRISGVVYEKEKSIKEMFPIAIGPLGVLNDNMKMGQFPQGLVKSGRLSIANLSGKDANVKFANVSPGLHISVEPQVIKAGEIGEISYTVNTNEKENWGNTIYSASVVCNGITAPKQLKFNCMIIDNLSALTKEEKNKGAMVLAKNSSVNLGSVAKGKGAVAEFSLRNTGFSDLKIHKADNNNKDFKIEAPAVVKPGAEFKVKAIIDTNKYTGEEVFTITLITNSPNRPLVNLFVSAIIN